MIIAWLYESQPSTNSSSDGQENIPKHPVAINEVSTIEKQPFSNMNDLTRNYGVSIDGDDETCERGRKWEKDPSKWVSKIHKQLRLE